MRTRTMHVAYLHYGAQSGVTNQVARALASRGHVVTELTVPGPLEPRGPDGRRRLTWGLVQALAHSAARFGPDAVAHRWNTPWAFDVHTRHAAALVRALPRPPDVVLQNGALFAPGLPGEGPGYVLLLDHTRALSLERPAQPDAGLGSPRDYGPGWRAREERTYRGARALATFSRRVAESLQRDYSINGDNIHVVGAGANVVPEAAVRADDGRTVLFVGKDFRRKGGTVLLQAFVAARRRVPDLKLLIAGPREPLELPEGATQLGLVPFDELAALFARATLFVLPTLREPFGLAFLDAMACALPCIGTFVEAVPEIVLHGETGLLVPPGQVDPLADAMVSLAADPARARALGAAGRSRVLETFLWTHVAERLELALEGRHAPRPELSHANVA